MQVQLEQPDWVSDFLGRQPRPANDEQYMALAIALSAASLDHNDGGPFAAVVADDESGEMIVATVNLVFASGASLAHAEMAALSFAQQYLGEPDLSEKKWTLYSSSEPCAMCTAALPWSGIHRVVCGARAEDVQATGFDEGSKSAAWVEALQSRGIGIRRDVMRSQAAEVLTAYAAAQGVIYNADSGRRY